MYRHLSDNLKTWVIAARLRTLPLVFSVVLVGTALAAGKVSLNYTVTGLTILTAVLLQVLSNLANDYGDAVSGVDSGQRRGPRRMTHSGAISKPAMRKAIMVCVILTIASGILLLVVSFPGHIKPAILFFLLGIGAIAAAINYTVGKRPYGYVGLGDFFVFLFFGWVSVAGTYFLQTKSFEALILLPATSFGLFSVGVLNVNNIRDIESDKASGKRSIAVRLGRKRAVIYHGLILSIGVGSLIAYVLLAYHSWLQLVFLPAGLLLVLNVNAVSTKKVEHLDFHLSQMVLATLLLSLLFTLGELSTLIF